MAGVMYLGNQMVSPVIVKGEDKIYNVDGADWLGAVNSQGVLVKDTKDINLVFNGVEDISANILKEKFKNDTRVKSVSFPDLEQITGSNACMSAFSGSGVTSISMPNLEFADGDNCCKSMLAGCSIFSIEFPKLKIVEGSNAFYDMLYEVSYNTPNPFPNLESVNGNYAFRNIFSNYTGEIIYLPKIEYIGDSGFYHAYYGNNSIKKIDMPMLREIGTDGLTENGGCSNLEIVNMPNLIKANDYCFEQAFAYDKKLKTVNLQSLETVGERSFFMTFFNSGVETITFNSLVSLGDSSFYGTFFRSTYIQGIYFPKLNSQSFNGYTNCFDSMLAGCSNVTVHFPSNLQSVIGGWSDVVAGFGGTNTTVLFDLEPTE